MSLPETPQPEEKKSLTPEERKTLIGVIAAVVILLALIVAAAVYLFTTAEGNTTRIRDIFIIFMALESLVIGVALIVLIAQVAALINLLQNEIRPILEATNETVKTLRGTSAFLGEHVAEPVIKLNSYLAGLKRLLEMVGFKQS